MSRFFLTPGFPARATVWPLLCASAVVLAAGAVHAEPHERLILEISPDAASRLDVRLTERLVVLETADLDVAAPSGVPFRPPLYFRILPLPEGAVRVELWELGKPYGARSVSGAGTDHLKARRIALAAAELGRQLQRRRMAELAAARQAVTADRADGGRAEGFPIHARFVASAGARGAALGGASAWLAGPELAATLRFDTGQRLSLGAGWLAGRYGDDGFRWLEASLSFAQSFALARTVALDAGLSLAAASTNVTGSEVTEGSMDGWSARAGAFAKVQIRIGRFLSLGVGPDLGVVLRPVSNGRADASRLGGAWLGGSLVLTVDPGAP